jgi:hypothetical protein
MTPNPSVRRFGNIIAHKIHMAAQASQMTEQETSFA